MRIPRPHLRFRIATLLWLVVVVSAFFIGRHADEIQESAKLWWQVTSVRLGKKVQRTEVIHWPPGSLTVNELFVIQAGTFTTEGDVTVSQTTSHQFRITPKSDGKSVVKFQSTHPQGHSVDNKFDIDFRQGRIHDWQGISSASRASQKPPTPVDMP